MLDAFGGLGVLLVAREWNDEGGDPGSNSRTYMLKGGLYSVILSANTISGRVLQGGLTESSVCHLRCQDQTLSTFFIELPPVGHGHPHFPCTERFACLPVAGEAS